MKLKNILYYLAVIVLLTSQLWAQNTNPVVTNVTFSISGTTVTVHYDVADADVLPGTVTISMQVSSNGGTTWDYNYNSPTTATGDIGPGINSQDGLIKTITWTYSGVENSNFKIMILANDNTADGSPCVGTEKVYYEGGPNNDGAAYYNTIQIGGQCWLKENLNVGTMINSTTGGSNSDGSQTNIPTIEKYCYNNNEAICTTYGGLYQWDEAMQYVTTEGAQGICPTGWHIPTNAEFATLSTIVGGDGNALKAIGQDNTNTNTSGFSALFTGYRLEAGTFNALGYDTFFWPSTEHDAAYSYDISLSYDNSNIHLDFNTKIFGFSVRCLKN
jgi:uncharacterized protein (TIGR02145 family)